MAELFGKFEVFQNKYGELVVANKEKEIVMENRETGYKSKCNIDDFCKLIKTIFPDREEQKELLIAMFGE